ncbi:MAG TPA: hypothetical protein VKD72_23625, partial [Gemmataceae bacterium]|nr:hypothetical protein [Gemmataceae bacterium]
MLEALRFVGMALRLLLLRRQRPDQILALQRKRLRQLLRHASEHSPFYRRRLRGLDPARCRLADVPPLTKADMMEHFDEVVTDRRVSRAGLERFLADAG